MPVHYNEVYEAIRRNMAQQPTDSSQEKIRRRIEDLRRQIQELEAQLTG